VPRAYKIELKLQSWKNVIYNIWGCPEFF